MMSTDTRPARPFGAVGTAMVTPFTPDASVIDHDAAQRLAVHLADTGNDMIVVSGTTGEAPVLADREKLDLARSVQGRSGTARGTWPAWAPTTPRPPSSSPPPLPRPAWAARRAAARSS